MGAGGTGPCSAPAFAGAGNSGYRSIGRGREGAAPAMHHPRCRRLQLTLHNEPTPLPAGGGTPSLCPPPCHHLGPIRAIGTEIGEGCRSAEGSLRSGSVGEDGSRIQGIRGCLGNRSWVVIWGWPQVALLVPPSPCQRGGPAAAVLVQLRGM